MKKIFLPIILLTCVSVSFAQSYCTIKKAQAFFNVSMPGVQMADENGNPVPPKPNITRFIYAEYSGSKMPDIKTVVYNGKALSFTIVSLKEKIVSVGDPKISPNYKLSAKKGNSILKIGLQAEEGKTMPETDCKNIIIKSRVAGKICRFYIYAEKQFITAPRY